MIEFDSFCYLQNHKTGCTFVETFLRAFSTEQVRMYHKHAALSARNPDQFYFVNVRDPVEVYLSLYNFGLDGSGEIFERLRAAGHAGLYARGIEGFEAWLDFVLDAKNAQLLTPAYSPPVAAQVGLVSYRFLRLACPGFASACARFSGAADVRRHFEREKIIGAVIRYEALTEDLSSLIAGPLKHAINDIGAAQAWIRGTPPINPSNRRDRLTPVALAPATLDKLRAREWFMYENFYTQ